MSRMIVNADSTPPFIVYIPGISGTGALAAPFLQKTQSTYDLTQLHYPGRTRLTLEELADGCVSALAEQGRQKAIWMGESFGSAVALSIALRHPSAVEGLILASGFTRAPSPSRLLLAARIWESSPESWRKSFLRSRLHRLARRRPGRLSRDQMEDFLANGQHEFISWRLRLLAAFDVRGSLSNLNAPILYLGGEEDSIVDVQEEAAVLRECCKDVRPFLFPGCGHAVLTERPDECLELLANFLPRARRVAA